VTAAAARIARIASPVAVLAVAVILVWATFRPAPPSGWWRPAPEDLDAIRQSEARFVREHAPGDAGAVLDAIGRMNAAEARTAGSAGDPEVGRAIAGARAEASGFVTREGAAAYAAKGLEMTGVFSRAWGAFCRGQDGVTPASMAASAGAGDLVRVSGGFVHEAGRTGLPCGPDDDAAVFLAESLFLVRWLGLPDPPDGTLALLPATRRFVIAAWKAEFHPSLSPERRADLAWEARRIRPDYPVEQVLKRWQ
jgi:hypothetical protein